MRFLKPLLASFLFVVRCATMAGRGSTEDKYNALVEEYNKLHEELSQTQATLQQAAEYGQMLLTQAEGRK